MFVHPPGNPSLSLSLSLSDLFRQITDMRLQFHHRKLIEDSIKGSIKDSIKDVCLSLCESSDDSDICDSPCSLFCENCNYPPPPPPPPPQHQSLLHSSKSRKFLIISAALLAAAFLALCCYVVYVKLYLGWYGSRRRRRSRSDPQTINQTHDDIIDEDRDPVVDHHVWYIQTVGLQPSVIGAITVCKYKSGDGLVEGTECSVCLNEFQEDETLRLLPKCNHAFHLPCIDTWLTSHTNCPMCRAPIVRNSASGADNSASGADAGDAQIEVSEENGETETRLGDEEVSEEERVENPDQKDDHEMQPMRRSVSLDFLSATKISRALANPNAQLEEEDTDSRTETAPKPVDDRSDSLARFVATSSSSIRRSLSCSGKFLLSKNSYRRRD